MSTKEAYEKKLQSQLDEWGAEISKLKAKADSVSADTQIEYHKQIEELQSMQEEASKKLDELKSAGNDTWEDLKASIDSTWDSFSKSVKSVVSRFS